MVVMEHRLAQHSLRVNLCHLATLSGVNVSLSPITLPGVWGCWATEKRMTPHSDLRRGGGPEPQGHWATGLSCSVALQLPVHITTGGLTWMKWMWCRKRRHSAMPTFFQNFLRKARSITETLLLSNVTTQMIPHRIACHSPMQFEKRYWQAWHDGITKWHCHTCPREMTNATWDDKCHQRLRAAARLGVFSPEKITRHGFEWRHPLLSLKRSPANSDLGCH